LRIDGRIEDWQATRRHVHHTSPLAAILRVIGGGIRNDPFMRGFRLIRQGIDIGSALFGI
jgi:hypothetical protein